MTALPQYLQLRTVSAPQSTFLSVDCLKRKRPSGSALLIVLWAIMIMSFAVMGTAKFLEYGVDASVLESQRFECLHLAESGIAVALHPSIQPGDPALKQSLGSDRGFEVTLASEGAFFPINQVSIEVYREALYRLFIHWELSPQEANIAVDSLADWVDSDNEARSQGAENDYYKSVGFDEFPRQQTFSSVNEMILVRGMEAVERAKPDWRNYFSTNGDGLVDLANASADVIMAFCDCAESAALQWIRQRNGSDGLYGTEDDSAGSVDDARSVLGISQSHYRNIQTYLTTTHQTRRIESVGRIGEIKLKIAVIARVQTDGSLNYLARLEE